MCINNNVHKICWCMSLVSISHQVGQFLSFSQPVSPPKRPRHIRALTTKYTNTNANANTNTPNTPNIQIQIQIFQGLDNPISNTSLAKLCLEVLRNIFEKGLALKWTENEACLLVIHHKQCIAMCVSTVYVCLGQGGGVLMENNLEEENKEQQKFPFFISPSASICKYEGWGLGWGRDIAAVVAPLFLRTICKSHFWWETQILKMPLLLPDSNFKNATFAPGLKF